jgi:hypothetical protein
MCHSTNIQRSSSQTPSIENFFFYSKHKILPPQLLEPRRLISQRRRKQRRRRAIRAPAASPAGLQANQHAALVLQL